MKSLFSELAVCVLENVAVGLRERLVSCDFVDLIWKMFSIRFVFASLYDEGFLSSEEMASFLLIFKLYCHIIVLKNRNFIIVLYQ